MAIIYVDNQPFIVEDGQNLLHVCLGLGFNLPYFCWHPALGSVGACRLCAVKQFKDEKDLNGRMVMACMTPAVDSTRISIEDREAKAFRAGVIEWLMANHPHDCPICDEGGECHLQDMTVMTGHTYRRYRFPKRTFRNQYLGPFINHEMNRCIECYRCVRFYRDYAGGRDLDVFAAHNHVYFGRSEDGTLENEFSGNLVEVCPTGVFTDKTLKQHYTRKWDLQTAPSVCVHCGLGCNTIPGERYGMLRRIYNRYNGEVNGYFLCDRGRYGYEFVNSDRRIRRPLLRKQGNSRLEPVERDYIIQYLKPLLSESSRIIGIGSPRASLEANFALRTLVGPERFYSGMSERDTRLVATALKILMEGPARTPSLHDVELADAILVLGEDVTNTAPRLALALRQSVLRKPLEIAARLKIPEWDAVAVREAIQEEKGPLFIAATYQTKLDDVAAETYQAAPDDLARLGFAVANSLDRSAPPVENLRDEVRSLAERIARTMMAADRPLIISGTGCGSDAVMQAAANVAWALCKNGRAAQLCLTMPECNSLGVALIGGNSLKDAFERMEEKAVETVIILENDLYRQAGREVVDAMLKAASHIIVIDHLTNASTAHAEIVLPAATFAEGDGTLVSSEGRAQRFYQVFVPDNEIQESWRWLRDLMIAANRSEGAAWHNLDDIASALAATLPDFSPILKIAPPAGFRIAGQKIPREPHRHSGRTAILAHIDVNEPPPPADPDSPLAFSMEGYDGIPPSPLITHYWASGWNSVQALNKFQDEIGGPLRGGDPGQRLIKTVPGGEVSYYQNVPAPFESRESEWLIVPLYQIFGSEELSILSRGIAERSPQPYLALNPGDASDLRVIEGEEMELVVDGLSHRLPIQLWPSLPRGIAGLPAGLRELPVIALPVWGSLSRGSRR
jgi:NADH-quinone oxidoreductase subunit G